jgi:hypothetical protein
MRSFDLYIILYCIVLYCQTGRPRDVPSLSRGQINLVFNVFNALGLFVPCT